MKLSYYTLFSDSLNQRNDRVMFSTRSQEIFLVSSCTYDNILRNDFEQFSLVEKEQLVNSRFIVNDDDNELLEIIAENQREIDDDTLCYEVIQPSAMCQLGCDYCGQLHEKVSMSVAIVEGILDRIDQKLATGRFKKLYIGWFGAEPLMGLGQIRTISTRLKEMCDKHNIPYGSKIVTNGLSLKVNIFKELITEWKVDHIEITLDGIAESHDQRRYTKEKEKTFDLIFNNILNIVNLPNYRDFACSLSIRCNVDERNDDFVSPLISLLAEKELQNKISYFYPIGVYSWGNDAHKKSITKEEFAVKEIEWIIEMISKGFKPSILPGRVKKVCLSVSKSSEMYDAYGNVFNCTEVSYVDKYKGTEYVLGNVLKPEALANKKRPLMDWNAKILDGQFPCTTCKMLPVCGGACPKSWHEDMRACPPSKFNIKEKLALAYVSSQCDIRELMDPENIISNL